MVTEHQQWLAQLEKKSMEKQEQFMNDIASKLKRPRQRHAPTQPFRGAPDFWTELEWDEEKRIQAFTDNFVSVGAHIARVQNMEEVSQFIANKSHELSAKYIIRQNEQALQDLGLEEQLPDVQISVWNSQADENWKARAAEADIGVVMADYATAYTGSVTVLSSPEKVVQSVYCLRYSSSLFQWTDCTPDWVRRWIDLTKREERIFRQAFTLFPGQADLPILKMI